MIHLRPFLLILLVLLAAACSTGAGETQPAGPPLEPSPTAVRLQHTLEAEGTLVHFFSQLHAGDFQDAAMMYGGPYDILAAYNPGLEAGNSPAMLASACQQNGFQCLEVLSVELQDQPAEDFWVFEVKFQNEDGSLFTLGPCCGESSPGAVIRDTFPVSVTVTTSGEYRVLTLPPYVP
jgi:hypothetical protein